MNTPKTIKIFLAEGNPTGVKEVELSNWTGKGVIIPRNSLKAALESNDLNSQAVYFLVGEDKQGKKLYIGESESFHDRIKHHHQNKDFWDTAICFFSKDDSLNKAHVKYLESVLITAAEIAGRVTLETKKSSKQPKLSASDEAFAQSFGQNLKMVLSGIGYTFLKDPVEDEVDRGRYYFSGEGFDASGMPTSEGFVVFGGSEFRRRETESFADSYGSRTRNRLLENEVLEIKNDTSFILTKDKVFSSPSHASSSVAGRSTNGWTSWEDESGNTLDENERQSTE